MPASSNSIWSSVRSRPRQLASHPELPLPVLLCAIRTARRMRLRLDQRNGVLKVTYPRSVRPAAALAWAAAQKPWVEEQMERSPPLEPLIPGACIPVDGAEVELRWDVTAARTPSFRDGMLICGGPREGFSRRVEQFLKRLALDTLARETAEVTQRAGLRAVSVSVGDARTRWGSCNSKGAIRYNWRLILAPPEVRRYVVCHEVAHLRHLDHSRRFRDFERQLFGSDTAAAEELLRASGPRLRRIGVTG